MNTDVTEVSLNIGYLLKHTKQNKNKRIFKIQRNMDTN